MSKVLTLILSVLLISCGTRKRSVEKEEIKQEIKATEQATSISKGEDKIESQADFNRYLSDIGLKIVSKGDYKLELGDFKFSGSADLDFSNKTEKQEEKHIYKRYKQYYTHTTYKSHITYKTQTNHKSVITFANKGNFWQYVFIISVCIVIWEIIKHQFKKINLKKL